MKKSSVLAGAVVLVAAAYTGVSWYVGVQSEETIRTAVERANDRIINTLGPDLGTVGATIEISEYRRGLFSSRARYAIIVQNDGERLELGMHDHMQHGPLPWDLLKQGSFTPLLAYSRSQLIDTEAVKRWFDAARGAMPLQVDTRIRFGGDGESVWTFAPLEWAVDGDRLSFSGGHMDVRFRDEFRNSEGEGRFASLVMGGDEGETVVLKDVELHSETSTADDETVQMRSSLLAASLAIHDMTSESLTVEQASVTLDSRQQASLLDASLRYDFGRVSVGDIDLGSVSVGGMVARFDFDAFSALLAEYDAIAREHGAEEGEDFELTPQDEERLVAKVLPALASSPEAALRPVVWRNEKGESTLALSAAFQPVAGDENVSQEEVLMQGLRELRFELVLSRPMFLQAFAQTGSSEAERQQLEMLAAVMFDRYVSGLEQDGLVRREGDQAFVTIVYGDGEVDVNGQAMSLDEFLGLFGGFLM